MDTANEETQSVQDHPREYHIIVNGREKAWGEREISFDQVVTLAFDNPPGGDNWLITVTYKRGHGDKPEGSLEPGESVRVKEGMIFNVSATNRS